MTEEDRWRLWRQALVDAKKLSTYPKRYTRLIAGVDQILATFPPAPPAPGPVTKQITETLALSP